VKKEKDSVILAPTDFRKKPPPYNSILHAPWPTGVNDDELVAELERRNQTIRFAQTIEKSVLEALEDGKLPKLEARITKHVSRTLTTRIMKKIAHRVANALVVKP
jgi:hypothetical protein